LLRFLFRFLHPHPGRGQARTVHVRIEPPPGGGAMSEVHLSGHNPLDGATVIDLSPAATQQLGVDPFAVSGGGVLVTKISEGFAAQLGLQPGDMIRDVNGQTTGTVRALQAVLASGGHDWRITIQRQGQRITANVRL
jgi:S1-C subfamily serine protease